MSRNNAATLCEVLRERGAKDVTGLALGPKCSWADYLVIGTCTSRVHMQGLAAAVIDTALSLGMELRGNSKRSDEENWRIIDGGDIVVSLMSREARDFYGLEELWFEAERIDMENQSSISS